MTIYRIRRKKGSVWVYDFFHQGLRYKKEGFLTRTEAVIAEAENRRMLQAQPLTSIPCITIEDLAQQYLIECKKVKGLAFNTIRQKMLVLNSFAKYVGYEIPSESICRTHVKKYLKFRTVISAKNGKPAYCAANRDKKEIKALFNWGFQEEIIPLMHNPCKGIKDFPEDEFRKYVPPTKDIEEVKLQATADQKDFIECLYYLLGRRKEIQYLKWADVNFKTRWADLWTLKKGGGMRRMPKPMNDEVVGILQRRYGQRDSKTENVFSFELRDLDRMMPKLCKKAGVREFGFHALRHHAASTLLENGFSLHEIKFMLGHERISTTERYLHTMTGDFHRLANSLSEKVTRCHTAN